MKTTSDLGPSTSDLAPQGVSFPDELNVHIPNWSRYNPRADRANYTWFRMQNDFFVDQSVFALTTQQKMIYLFLICEASKRNKDVVTIRISFISALLKIDQYAVKKDVDMIHDLDLIEVTIPRREGRPIVMSETQPAPCRHHDGVTPSQLLATYDTNERDETDETDETKVQDTKRARSSISRSLSNGKSFPLFESQFDFLVLYDKYPRKEGREEGLIRCKQLILTQEDYNLLSVAINNYANHCRKTAKSVEYIMHFSTFIENRKSKPYVQRWREWADPTTGSAGPDLPQMEGANKKTQNRIAGYEAWRAKQQSRGDNEPGGIND